MNLEDNQFDDIFKKEFKFGKEKINFKELYKKLEEKQSPFESLYYSSVYSKYGIHSLNDPENWKNQFFFAKKKYTLKIRDSEKEIKKCEILSNYEIIEIVNKAGKDNIYFGKHKFASNINYFRQANNSNEIELYYDKDIFIELPKFTNQIFIAKDTQIKPISLTQNFSLYFQDNPNEDITFYLTEERENLRDLILACFNENNKIFKFTGPSGIGKSLFCLYYSRKFFNNVYLNIASLNYFEKNNQYNKMRNLITEEFKRVKFNEEQVKNFNEMIKNLSLFNINNIIKTLIEFCENTKININIILDQFKEEINLNELNLTNITIIVCSSINDKNIRTSCIHYLKNNLNDKKFDYSLYFYIHKLFEFNEENNKLFSYFGNIPKYTLKIKNCKKYEEYHEAINNIKIKVIEKLKNFYEGENYYQNIMKVKQNLDIFIPIIKFDEFINIFPLKYFKISFYKSDDEKNILFENNISIAKYFKIEYLFPFLIEIFEELINEKQNKFFTDGLFIKHTDSTVGGFFELVSIDAIRKKKITLPNNQMQTILRVSKICNMDEIKPTLYKYIESTFNEKEKGEEKKKIEDENKMDIEKSEIKGDKLDLSAIKISKCLSKNFINNYIFSENKLLNISNEYCQNFPNFEIFVDNELKYKQYNDIINIGDIKKTLIKNHDYSYKDQSILITQEKENAEIYDLAYLYGPNNNKTFIGFQMKSYRDLENMKYNNYKLSKEKVLNKSKQLLINSKYLLNIEITDWHYFVLGIFFDEGDIKKFSLKNSYSENLIQFCHQNDLELILYNPINEKFYDSNKNIIKELKINNLSRICGENKKIFKFEEKNDFLGKKRTPERCLELGELIKDILNYKESENIDERKIMSNIIDKIKTIFNLNNLKFIGKKKYHEEYEFYPIPGDNHFLIFEKINSNKDKGLDKYYIFIKFHGNKPYIYDIKNNIKLFKYSFDIQYFHYFNLEKNYYAFSFE